MDTPLTLVTTEPTEPEPKPIVRTWRELPVTEDMLFRGTDERGRSGWFMRLTVGGMFPRRRSLATILSNELKYRDAVIDDDFGARENHVPRALSP